MLRTTLSEVIDYGSRFARRVTTVAIPARKTVPNTRFALIWAVLSISPVPVVGSVFTATVLTGVCVEADIVGICGICVGFDVVVAVGSVVVVDSIVSVGFAVAVGSEVSVGLTVAVGVAGITGPGGPCSPCGPGSP